VRLAPVRVSAIRHMNTTFHRDHVRVFSGQSESQSLYDLVCQKPCSPCASLGFARTTSVNLPTRVVPSGIAGWGKATWRSQWLRHIHPNLVLPAACSLSRPLISFLSSIELGMLPSRQASRPRRPGFPPPTPTQIHWVLCPLMPLRGRALRAIRVSPNFRVTPAVVFACAPPSQCFRFCSLFFSALPACQTELASPRSC
jgi:hypothetical protein